MTEDEQQVKRGHRVIAIAMVSVFLVACTLVGAVLIPEAGWPGGSRDWLLSVLGAVMVVAAALVGAYAQRIVGVLSKAVARPYTMFGNVTRNPRRLLFSALPLVVVILVWFFPGNWSGRF